MTYIIHSKFVQKFLTLDQLHEMWNATGYGRPSQIKTIHRWLNNGPKTKNPRFEPWIITISTTISTVGKVEQSTTVSITDKINWLFDCNDLSDKEKALVVSLKAYREYSKLSQGQEQILDKIYARKIKN